MVALPPPSKDVFSVTGSPLFFPSSFDRDFCFIDDDDDVDDDSVVLLLELTTPSSPVAVEK